VGCWWRRRRRRRREEEEGSDLPVISCKTEQKQVITTIF
jgi:hypothetical protein